jgi:hypothetical protein
MKVVKPNLITSTRTFTRASTATYYDSSGLLKTAANNELRIGYNPETLEFEGAIIEAQGTNQFTYSNDFTQSSVWVVTGGSLAASYVSPTGASNATKFILSNLTEQHTISRLITSSSTPDLDYLVSIYVKAEGHNYIRVSSYSNSFDFDLSTGVAYSIVGETPIIEKLQNGFYRIAINHNTPDSVYLTYRIRLIDSAGNTTFQGDGISGILIYGSQLEYQKLPTSYIETTSITATREADVISGNGLVYTNVTNAYPEWSASSVSYTIGQYVSVGTWNGGSDTAISDTTTGTYLCLVSHTSSASNGPLQSVTNWVRTGPTNQFAVFDTKISSQTTAGNELIFVIKTTSLDTISALNINAEKVLVAVSDYAKPNNSIRNIIFNRTEYVSGTESFDWYSYFFFDEDTQKTQIVFSGIISSAENVITVRLSSSGNTAIGISVVGNTKFIGDTQYGVTSGIIDYSKKEIDEFGNSSLIVRNYSKRINAKVYLTNANLNSVQRFLYSIRANPVLWIASEDIQYSEPLIVYGFYRDFNTEISYPSASLCDLTIEGLI